MKESQAIKKRKCYTAPSLTTRGVRVRHFFTLQSYIYIYFQNVGHSRLWIVIKRVTMRTYLITSQWCYQLQINNIYLYIFFNTANTSGAAQSMVHFFSKLSCKFWIEMIFFVWVDVTIWFELLVTISKAVYLDLIVAEIR